MWSPRPLLQDNVRQRARVQAHDNDPELAARLVSDELWQQRDDLRGGRGVRLYRRDREPLA
eukprot:11163528-Lingulodinium_polyedra.AAC.1